MCLKSASRGALSLAALLVWAAAGFTLLDAQTADAQTAAPDWRRIGNSALELALPSLATGSVDRVWYSLDGSSLFVRTPAGLIFESQDLEQWRIADSKNVVPPPAANDSVGSGIPESHLKLQASVDGRHLYGYGNFAYKSEDAGQTWTNLTGYKGNSILGSSLLDLAVSPRDSDEIVAAAATGVWRSVDGGLSWSGLNQSLPNLPVRRLRATPAGTNGLRISLRVFGDAEFEWAPGEKTAWKPSRNNDAEREAALEQALSQSLKASITAVATAGANIYAGSTDGQLWASSDRGATWHAAPINPGERANGAVESIFVDPKDPRIALAVYGSRRFVRVVRTMNGGQFWDDITANLPETAAHGIVADLASGAIYVATDAGVFFTRTNLASAGQATPWESIGGNLPLAPARDVRLDAGANQLFAALDGYGVYAAIAPHRLRDVRVVNAADYSARPAAPGGLLSVLGTRILSAQTPDFSIPVLAASDSASQIQVPFEARGNSLALTLEATSGRLSFGMPLAPVSPAIFVDPDGTPLILDADSGILLDGSKPAHAKSRIQILATGLGRVSPDWLAGVPAPANDPPRVVAPVRVLVNGLPLEMRQASLAPGYPGYYLVEAILPELVNAGAADLYIEAGGQASNRVRLTIEQ
ncbi:MAG: hypothetical protein M3Y27_09475 [Acidobacteriota bacterium]|nr:hypothetical protein [Acidobacteriota bacterium]